MSSLARLIRDRLDVIVRRSASLISVIGAYSTRPIEELHHNVKLLLEGALSLMESGDESKLEEALSEIARLRSSLNFKLGDVQRALIICRDVIFSEIGKQVDRPEERLSLFRELMGYYDLILCRYSDMYQEIIRAKTEEIARIRESAKLERLTLIGRMAAQIAHEIRNPISSINLNLELLEDELEEFRGHVRTDEAEELVKSIREVLEGLSKFVQDYLQFARLPSMEFNPHDINAIVKDLLSFLAGEIRDRNVKLITDFDRNIPTLMLDEDQLNRALMNVLKNSLEAMPQGGRLSVSTKLEGDEVLISISDSGTGIERHEWERIFLPFYSTKKGGTGLGLPLAEQIIREHGGSISLTSAVGRGTTFMIRLPVSRRR
jgi:signal transduction histidine kinase